MLSFLTFSILHFLVSIYYLDYSLSHQCVYNPEDKPPKTWRWFLWDKGKPGHCFPVTDNFIICCVQTRVSQVAQWQRTHLPMQEIRDMGSIPGLGRTLWRKTWQPTPVFLPGESHGQRSLVGYSPKGRKESTATEWPCIDAQVQTKFFFLVIGSDITRFYTWHGTLVLDTYNMENKM